MRECISLLLSGLWLAACGRSDLLPMRSSSDGSSDGSSIRCDGIDTQTDNQNCGACGNRCFAAAPSKAQCALGRCLVTLATDSMLTSESSLAVGTTAVYWTLPEKGKVMTVPVEGGTPKVFAKGERTFDVAVDAKNVYWSDYYTNKVMKMPIEGGTPTVLVSGQSYLRGGIVVGATDLYWTTWGGNNGYFWGTVQTVPLAGGTPKVLASGLSNPEGLFVNASNVYWMDIQIVTVAIAGGPVTTVVTDFATIISADATNIYYRKVGGEVMQQPLAGGPTTMMAQADGPAVADSTNLYWVSYVLLSSTDEYTMFRFKIMKAPLTGGPVIILASFQEPNLGTVFRMAVQGNSLYWTMGGEGASLMKLSPR